MQAVGRGIIGYLCAHGVEDLDGYLGSVWQIKLYDCLLSERVEVNNEFTNTVRFLYGNGLTGLLHRLLRAAATGALQWISRLKTAISCLR